MICSCCWEDTPVIFSASPPMLTSTVRPVRKVHPRTAASTARSPPADQRPMEPLGPLRHRPGGERADRGSIHAKQLSTQLPGKIRQLLRIAVRHRDRLHD